MIFFKKRLNKKGFTLVELLIVIAVLGIIAGIGVKSMSGITDTFKERADAKTCEMLARNLEIHVMAGEKIGLTAPSGGKTAAAALGADLTSAKSQKTNNAFTITAYTAPVVATDGTVTTAGSVTFSDGGTTAKTYTVAIKGAEVK